MTCSCRLRLSARSKPLGDKLPALVKYMTHETGTYFLDYSLEQWPHHIQWSQSNFDGLVSEWKIAKKIMDEEDKLWHWLIENPEQLEKIFLPFEQVGDAKQNAQGTGLGLPITLQLLSLMDADFQVESKLGEGSRFWFDLTLPIAQMTVEEIEGEREIIREKVLIYSLTS